MATAPDFLFGPERITHVTPIGWKCVILYDAIKIDPAKPKIRNPKCAFLHGPDRHPVCRHRTSRVEEGGIPIQKSLGR